MKQIGRTRVSLIILLVPILFLFAVLFAAPSYAHADPDPLPSEETTLGPNFHQGFSSTTNKCEACHSAHKASGEGEYLLEDLASLSCAYCHIDTSMANSNLQVYGGSVENYTSEPTTGSAHWMSGTPEQPGKTTCADCHYVHASSGDELEDNAATGAFRLQRVTSSDPGFAEYDANPVASTDSTQTALSKWCIKCHPTADHSTAHVIPSPGSIGGDGGIDQCMTCHAAEYGTPEWPHYSATASRFLLSSESVTSEKFNAGTAQEDGVCLQCHRRAPNSDITRNPKDSQL